MANYPNYLSWRCADPSCSNGPQLATRTRPRSRTFPESWGPVPADEETRHAWILEHATAAAGPAAARRQLERRYVGP